MKRIYKDENVYDATIKRFDFIFANFERIYLSFSGGKDSGVIPMGFLTRYLIL